MIAARNIFPLPSSTPAEVPYQNLIDSSQYARNNFEPTKRKFAKTLSADENEAVLRLRLKQYWGHSEFRYPQLEICSSAMKDHDILVVAPTGLGKSVCFQVPAIVKAYGITLVVSPLLALMKDQVRSLQDKNLCAEMLCHETEESKRKERLANGPSKYSASLRHPRDAIQQASSSRSPGRLFATTVVPAGG
ncbi:hypothetical protein BCR39DRAFT_588545 [Naematelia encephala]|uniref:DEAD/DEAH-box helicase domain-containing protein n=1 Tax=Naematelia encephala TaxID=71784 RepID=A0A1Y2B4M4_9TREE|nr:hypothetical protein BCR39DRAFT_588545 [Naematelia encephala]